MFQVEDLHYKSKHNISIDISNNNISKIGTFNVHGLRYHDFNPKNHSRYLKKQKNSRTLNFYIPGNPINDYYEDCILEETDGTYTFFITHTETNNLQCVQQNKSLVLTQYEFIPFAYFDYQDIDHSFRNLTCRLKSEEKYSLCMEQCSCQYRASDNALIIICHQQKLTSVPAALPDIEFSSYTELNLSGNRIKSIKFPLGPGYSKVIKYILSGNVINEIDLTAFSSRLQVCSIITVLYITFVQ